MDRDVALGLPVDAHRTVSFHASILTRRTAALLLALLLMPIGPAAPAAAKPAGFEHLPTPAELEATIDATVAAHPGIARKFSIGESYQGRDIWAVKISDNVALDEAEPEVVIMAQIHAREWVSNALAMYLISALTEEYATSSRIRAIVDSREIFIVPMLNPDGAEYDIAGGTLKAWRKNRQPIPGSRAIGIDLNRNFGFKWNCCGGGSNTPSAEKYRGWAPWVAPEVIAFRNFIDSRVVGGRQQIAASLTFHSAARLVVWPYAYTTADVPATMTTDDQRAFVALGRRMAQLNGYRPMQGSDLYVADGDHDDWAYYAHRIFALTFEMARGKDRRYYPSAAEMADQSATNREAVLYFLEQADCPYRAAGMAATRCGPLNDDFEADRGWMVDPFGTDTAPRGRFERATPQRTRTSAGVKQRRVVPSGQAALVTGALKGGGANANDVDGGTTSVSSPPFKIGAGRRWRLAFRYAFAHDARATAADFLRISIIDGGTRTVVFSQAGRAANRNAAWTSVTLSLDGHAGKTVRLLIEAADNGADSLVEAALDDVRVYRLP